MTDLGATAGSVVSFSDLQTMEEKGLAAGLIFKDSGKKEQPTHIEYTSHRMDF